jgi:hypothetical protein
MGLSIHHFAFLAALAIALAAIDRLW